MIATKMIYYTIGMCLLNLLMLRSLSGGLALSAKIGEEGPGKEKGMEVSTLLTTSLSFLITPS
jgi:hypothetical protein